MSYILTVLSNGNLEHLSLFAGWTAAFESAKSWAKAVVVKDDFIDTTPDQEFGQGYQLWKFVDTNRTQVSVWFMPASTDPSLAPQHIVAKTLLDRLPPVMRSHPMPKVVSAPAIVDDPLADHLPAGWSRENKPLTLLQVRADVYNVKARTDLTEEQLWALALARVSKRPNCLFLLKPNMYPALDRPGLYSQKYALEELKKKTSVGVVIRNQELDHLAPWLGDGTESEDPQMMDDDDSSSWYDFGWTP